MIETRDEKRFFMAASCMKNNGGISSVIQLKSPSSKEEMTKILCV